MFASPLGLIALLAVPAVIALHLLRRRFTPRVVSAVFLWEEHERAPAEGRRLERLRATLSLVLESLAALLLALALAGPRGCAEGGEHRVVVLDGSASMAARGADGRSAAERAGRAVEALLDGLGGRDRVTLLESGPRGRVLAGPEATVDEARAALERWSPRGPAADPGPALSLAAALAGEGEILWITDRLPAEEEAPPARISLLAVGEPAANIGFVEASRTREGLAWTLASFAADAREGVVLLEVEGAAASRHPFRLEPGARASVSLPLPADAGRALARLAGPAGEPWLDALALDDAVLSVAPPRRTLRLGSALPAAMNRALGLASGPADALGVGRWVAAVPDSEAAPAGAADLRLALDAGEPGPGWTVRLSGPPSPSEQRRERPLVGPFLASGHPLMASWSGEGLIWTPGEPVALGPEDEPLLLAGGRALLVLHPAGARPRLTVDIDPWRSTLARSPDWPLLLAGLAELRRAALPGPEQVNLRAGEALVWAGAGTGEARVSSEDGERALPARGELLVEELPPGLHRIVPPEGEAREVAVNLLSAAESELRGASAGERPAEAPPARAGLAGGGLAGALGLAALALLVLDWALLGRRAR